MAKQQTLSVLQALEKAKKYCAYQERSQLEARLKLRSWHLPEEQTEWIISELISENFLNEMRYAKAYAEGKFRIKGWGREKIKYNLKAKGVSNYCITKALEGIADAYDTRLQQEAEKWLRTHAEGPQQRQKLIAFLMRKGYAYNDIMRYLSI
ncbi:MAG: regulatory protein RecX [Bacteroidales bacterium]|jgi:regulatory protein|nr:regulatory protein RecX [Bacteroidales bacterium]